MGARGSRHGFLSVLPGPELKGSFEITEKLVPVVIGAAPFRAERGMPDLDGDRFLIWTEPCLCINPLKAASVEPVVSGDKGEAT